MSDLTRLTRNYEISVWTLQDSFLTVLGASDDKYKGRIQNPEMKLVNDGTMEFNFSIPMYLDDGVTREVNPVWQSVYNAPTIAGMRKIKVVFNKNTEVEKVFEFLIIKVTKSHENDKPQCDVTCEGLAFHELGKVGYKIEFSTDTLTLENDKWYKSRPKYEWGTGKDYATQEEWQEAEDEWAEKEPNPTIDYWMYDIIGIDKYPGDNEIINANKWYYRVVMDWSDYSHVVDIPRANDKIYEEAFVTSWDSNLCPMNTNNSTNPDSITQYKEKTRIMDEKDSNIYNLTQKLAETFGVFCRYDYKYDDNYHIVARIITFYNNTIQDRENKIDFTYPYSSTKISREDDCVDIVTKLFVTPIEDQSSASGLITIVNSDANKTLEDYILNFNYLKSIETITDEQYAAIATYEKDIRQVNDELIPLQDRLLVKEDRLPKAEALLQVAKNAVSLDAERIGNAKKLARALTTSDGTDDGYITVPKESARAVILRSESDTYYYYDAPEQGMLPGSIKIHTMKSGQLDGGVKAGEPQDDEFNNFVRMTKIPKSSFEKTNVYLSFKYSPKLYYERIEQTWNTRLAKDTADQNTYQAEVDALKVEIDALKANIDAKLEEKNELIKDFEHLMGPALREGYWTPDNYDTTVGEKYSDFIDMSTADTEVNGANSPYISFLWDRERFDDEQEGYYKLGVDTQNKPYECIPLSDDQIEFIRSHQDKPVGVLYYEYKDSQTVSNPSERTIKSSVIGASIQLAFISNGSRVQMALLFTGITTYTNDEIEYMKNPAKGEASLGYIETAFNQTSQKFEKTIHRHSLIGNNWVTLNNSNFVVYPRIKVNSLELKNNTTDLTLNYQYTALEMYNDYYLFQRVDLVGSTQESNYYITFKPEVFLLYPDLFSLSGTHTGRFGIRYSISSASTAVYLDALEISKENSKPKVTYSVDPNILQENFTYTAYNSLNTIAFINDYELQFDQAQGYISSVSLNLDFPDKDTIEIKNYKNKFEDLFSTIVAQTQAMEKNERIFSAITQVISADGSIQAPALEGSLRKVDLNYAFNNGKLTINEKDGIWGISDDGVVAYRGGGIFTATEKDEYGNWIWNTGIVPQGINANLITAGQLDTNKIKVYSGDRIRFQLNGDGLFAYKAFFSDYDVLSNSQDYLDEAANKEDDANFAQYVTMNEDGLFLCAKKGALVVYDVDANTKNFREVGKTLNGSLLGNFPDILERVSISWDGLTLRNFENTKVFYADASTGNLTLSGTVYASKFVASSTSGQFIADGNSLGFYTNAQTPGEIFTISVNGNNTNINVRKKLSIAATDLYIGSTEINNCYDTKGTGAAEVSAHQTRLQNGTDQVGKVVTTGITISGNTLSITAATALTIAAGTSITLGTAQNGMTINPTGVTFTGAGSFIVNMSNFKVKADGTVEITGEISANSGTIAGWTLKDSGGHLTLQRVIGGQNIEMGSDGGYAGIWIGGDDAKTAMASMVHGTGSNVYSVTANNYTWSWKEGPQTWFADLDLNTLWNQGYFGKAYYIDSNGVAHYRE